MPSNSVPGLDFGPSRIVKGHNLALQERVRAARGVPQAVVKVVSYAQGKSQVMGQMRYISRKGKLELETDKGERVTTVEAQKALVQKWSWNFDPRKKSRDAVHLIFSMPYGSDPEALRNSVRKVLQREFEGHEAVFAIHQDKKHPHAHVILKLRGRGKDKKRDLRKADLYHLREVFAEAAREEGVEMAVSPRAARGVGRKGMKQVPYQLRQKKMVPKAEKETAQETVFELQKGRVEDKPWEKAMQKRNQAERQAYQAEAIKLRAAAARQSQQDQAMLLQAAADLERFSESMPTPKTLRQTILEFLGSPAPSKPQDRKPPAKGESGIER